MHYPTLYGHYLGMSITIVGNGYLQKTQFDVVSYQRDELSIILTLYGKMVAAGEWRDYGISALKEQAVFSIFRHTAEHPIYRIEKTPKLAAKQGQYSVVGMDGRILKRGRDLKTVLSVLERKLIKIVSS